MDRKSLVIVSFIISASFYLTMIEGLGKSVKYSLFVANAIIFVSSLERLSMVA